MRRRGGGRCDLTFVALHLCSCNPVSGRVPPLYHPDCIPCAVRPELRLDRNGYQQPPDAPAANKSHRSEDSGRLRDRAHGLGA